MAASSIVSAVVSFIPLSRSIGGLYMQQYSPHLWYGGAASYEASPEWKRSDSDTSLETEWSTYRLMATGRAVQMAGAGVASLHPSVRALISSLRHETVGSQRTLEVVR